MNNEKPAKFGGFVGGDRVCTRQTIGGDTNKRLSKLSLVNYISA